MIRLLLLIALAVALPGQVRALDQDRARAAMERGDIRPLDQILAAVRAVAPGDVIALDLKEKKGRWLYKVKVLTPAGKRREIRIDAKSLEIIKDDEDDDD